MLTDNCIYELESVRLLSYGLFSFVLILIQAHMPTNYDRLLYRKRML